MGTLLLARYFIASSFKSSYDTHELSLEVQPFHFTRYSSLSFLLHPLINLSIGQNSLSCSSDSSASNESCGKFDSVKSMLTGMSDRILICLGLGPCFHHFRRVNDHNFVLH